MRVCVYCEWETKINLRDLREYNGKWTTTTTTEKKQGNPAPFIFFDKEENKVKVWVWGEKRNFLNES